MSVSLNSAYLDLGLQELENREVGALILALRLLQRTPELPADLQDLKLDHPLTDEEIDALCERMNFCDVLLSGGEEE